MAQEPQETPPAGGGLERWTPLALVLLFLLALSGGVALLVRQSSPDGIEVVLPTPTASPTLQAYLTGAVAMPGVYTFNDGERLEDLLRQAGGVTDAADVGRLNLALRLRDEAHIHIPAMGETPLATSQNADTPRLNLNTATQRELEGLPGIGAGRAADIIAYREQNGGFKSPADLLEISGIGGTTLIGILDLVTVE